MIIARCFAALLALTLAQAAQAQDDCTRLRELSAKSAEVRDYALASLPDNLEFQITGGGGLNALSDPDVLKRLTRSALVHGDIQRADAVVAMINVLQPMTELSARAKILADATCK